MTEPGVCCDPDPVPPPFTTDGVVIDVPSDVPETELSPSSRRSPFCEERAPDLELLFLTPIAGCLCFSLVVVEAVEPARLFLVETGAAVTAGSGGAIVPGETPAGAGAEAVGSPASDTDTTDAVPPPPRRIPPLVLDLRRVDLVGGRGGLIALVGVGTDGDASTGGPVTRALPTNGIWNPCGRDPESNSPNFLFRPLFDDEGAAPPVPPALKASMAFAYNSRTM